MSLDRFVRSMAWLCVLGETGASGLNQSRNNN